MSKDGLNKNETAPEYLERLTRESHQAVTELLQAAHLKQGDLLVVGCSTSEVAGERIGSYSSPQMAESVFAGIKSAAREQGVFLAAQCCEHLNRALILEKEAADKYGYEPVNVIPQPKAGGSFATAAWKHFSQPMAVEHIRAHAGIDIGDTLIGMHLREVAVPVRISQKTIGSAHVVCARTRYKFVGGARAVYDETLL
ncbi:MAG: TIGR01440 family protein [Lachnospiraceae bacterium]|nr:TIGR01440 family protein [Lachnospiraceae bacterium]